MSYETNPLEINTTDRRFEINIDKQIAFINYKQGGKTIYLIHTEVPAPLEGKGVASALVEKTLHYVEENHLQLVPLCAFIQSYLEKHPDWKKLVREEKK